MLGNDLVVEEDSCNLSCSYCLTGQSNLKQGHRDRLIFQPPQPLQYAHGSDLAQRLDAIDGRVDAVLRPPLLKVTGGEIFLVRGILDFLERQAREHEILVVQTNGVLVREEHLDAFRRWGNVVVQLSLDGHTHQANSYRASNPRIHDMVLERACRILGSGIPVEVYCVLSDRSAPALAAFARWLLQFSTRPVLYPFPVRGPDAATFTAGPGGVAAVEELLESYAELEPVLPPRAYLMRLLRFYREGGRSFRCHLPRLVTSTFSDGVVTPCPNIWFSDMGNVLQQDHVETLGRIGSTGLYRALLAPAPRLSACRGCFTPWDTLSMYFDGELTLDELCSAPTYAAPGIRALVAALKARWEAERDGRG